MFFLWIFLIINLNKKMRDCKGFEEMSPDGQSQLIRDINYSADKAEYTFAAL
jgi:hypothetical protein